MKCEFPYLSTTPNLPVVSLRTEGGIVRELWYSQASRQLTVHLVQMQCSTPKRGVLALNLFVQFETTDRQRGSG